MEKVRVSIGLAVDMCYKHAACECLQSKIGRGKTDNAAASRKLFLYRSELIGIMTDDMLFGTSSKFLRWLVENSRLLTWSLPATYFDIPK